MAQHKRFGHRLGREDWAEGLGPNCVALGQQGRQLITSRSYMALYFPLVLRNNGCSSGLLTEVQDWSAGSGTSLCVEWTETLSGSPICPTRLCVLCFLQLCLTTKLSALWLLVCFLCVLMLHFSVVCHETLLFIPSVWCGVTSHTGWCV